MIQEYRLQEPDCAGYLQTVAVNVSEIYYNGEKIRANNEKECADMCADCHAKGLDICREDADTVQPKIGRAHV